MVLPIRPVCVRQAVFRYITACNLPKTEQHHDICSRCEMQWSPKTCLLQPSLSAVTPPDESAAQVLLRRIQAGDVETLPACAIALSNLAAASRRARAALGAMSAPIHLAEAAARAQTGAAHMALLQAILASSQVLACFPGRA